MSTDSLNKQDAPIALAQKYVFTPCNFKMTNLRLEKEAKEYSGSSFQLNEWDIVFRVGKITPRKIGQFITLWRRNDEGKTAPFHLSDRVDFFIVQVTQGGSLGQFIFPKNLLCEKGYVRNDKKVGKRAMRLYAPWDQPKSAQAQKTQRWQQPYFFAFGPLVSLDLDLVKTLFSS